MDINKIIDDWVDKSLVNLYLTEDIGTNYVQGKYDALQDLKSRKQELIEGIVGIIENLDTKCDYDEHCVCAGKEEIIEVLTGK